MHFDKKTLRNIFIGVGLCIVLYWLLNETERVKTVVRFISGVLSPFALGASLAFVLNVPMRAIEGLLKGIKAGAARRILAVLLTFVAVMLVLAIVFLLLIPQIIDTFDSLGPRLYAFFSKIEDMVVTFVNNNPKLMEITGAELGKLDWAGLVQEALRVVTNSISTILSRALTAIGSVSSALMDIVIAIVFAVYCLFQKETLSRQGRKLVYAFLPERFADQTVRILRLTNATFSNFFSGQCLEVCILGCMFAITMAIFKMPYIPLVSVLVAVTAFIPVVGAWVGCVLGAFFIFVANPLQAVWFVLMFIVLQQIENNLIYPRVVGTSIGLSGMWVLVAVGVGGDLMGVAGMFLMIPVTSVVYTLLREYTAKCLAIKEIPEEKLMDQPPQIQSRLKKRMDDKKKKSKKAPDGKD